MPFTIWTNAKFPETVTSELQSGTVPHRLLVATATSALNLVSAPPDQQLEQAEIAFGQPDANQLFGLTKLRWVHLTSAGYTNYDRDDLRKILKERGVALTTSSGVYDEPCAQHVFSMMMSFARQLHWSWREQSTDRAWSDAPIRRESFLLNGQTVLIFGFGAIARRLCELLSPFQMKLIGVRRNLAGNEPIPMITMSQQNDWISQADHVINILPANASTQGYFDEALFQRMKPSAYFYNIGRGVTVDQGALASILRDRRIAGAYLDVTSPEPLPPDHPLWNAPNCFITPHTAGGFRGEMQRLVTHFLENLARFSNQNELLNRVI